MSAKSITRIFDPDQAGSVTNRCRQLRNEEFKRRFPDLAEMRVLDLGGTALSWRTTGLRAKAVVLVNLDDVGQPEEPWLTHIRADACSGDFGKFDLVFSNSLLEHLGGHARREQLVEVIEKSAPRWWVQTPYRYFPIEPHWVFPGFQFLPFRTRVAITRHWNVGHQPATTDKAAAAKLVASVELVSATEMRSYFPTSEIWFERFAGVPKSIVAIRGGT
jgi:hypothetical protein